MQRARQVFLGHGLSEKQQGVKPLLQIAVQKTGPGSVAVPPRHQPEMRNPVRGVAMRHQIADQRVIAFAAALRSEDVAAVTVTGKGIAGADHHHLMAGGAQPGRSFRRQPRLIGKDQPALARPLGQIAGQIDPGFRRSPLRLPAPIGNVGQTRRQRRRLDRCGLAGRDEIGLALKGIARQRHAAAGRVPDRLPIDRHAAGPGPRQRRHVPGIVGHRLFGMAQRRDHLRACHAIGLRQRRHRPPRPHFHVEPPRCFGQRRHAGAKIHRAAQMRHPIVRVHRLGITQAQTAAVGDDRQFRQVQRDGAQIGTEPVQNPLQHLAVGGDVDGDALHLDPFGQQFCGQIGQGGVGAGDDAEIRGVDRGQVHLMGRSGGRPPHPRDIWTKMNGKAGKCAAQGGFAERDGQHSARCHLVKQRAAQVDQADAVFEADHPGQGGGGVFAHRMADQQRGLHPPTDEQLRQRVFDDHDQRQLHRGAFQLVRRRRLGPRFGQPEGADVVIEFRLQHGEAAVDPVGKHRLGRVKVAGHAGVLRAAAGEHEHHLGIGPEMVVVEDFSRIGPFQKRRRLVMAFGHQHPSLVEGAAALFQRKGHIGQGLFGMGPQMRCQPRRRRIQRRFRACRQHEGLERPDRLPRRRGLWRLLQHGMGVGAAHPQRIDPGAQDLALPIRQPVIDNEGRGGKINGRIGGFIAQRRRQLPVVQRQRHLDQRGHPRRRVQMPDVGLDRADAASADRLGRFAEGRGQRRHLDRVAQIGAGAVAFDVGNLVRGDAGHRLRLGNGLGLAIDRRGQIAGFGRAIVVDRRTLDDGPDMITVAQGIPRPAQHHAARAGPEHRALRARVKGMAMAVGRQDLALGEQIAAVLRQFDRHPAGQRHVAFAVNERLRRDMHRHQRGRTGGLHIDTRPRQVEDMADAGGEEILVIAGVAQQEQAGVLDQPGVGTKVEVEIAAHAAAGIDADGPVEIFGRVTGVFQRLPGHFHELAVLGVEDGGLFRGKAEEIGVEISKSVKRRGGGHIIAACHPGRAFACSQQFRLGQGADAFDPARKILPEGCNVARTGQMRRHPDNGDVGFGQIFRCRHG